MEISREHFQKICKWWNFQNVNHSTEIQEILGGEWNEIEIPGKKCLKIWEYLLWLSSFPEILGNAVPFNIGNFKPSS